MTTAIESYQGRISAFARLKKILELKYNDELVDLYNVTNDLTPEGIALPGLDFVWKQTDPRPDQRTDVGDVVAFLGPAGPSQRRTEYSAVGPYWCAQVAVPFAVTIAFDVLPQELVDDADTSRSLREVEILTERADRYLGALIHTITKWGGRHEAIWDIEHRTDFPEIDYWRVEGGELRATASAYFEFDVIAYWAFPEKQSL